jgi:uncharacterized membrane protein YgdD (TMEM256/DUF423 family)
MPRHLDWFSRLMLVLAGILGASGVLAAAAASHLGDERILGAVSLIALPHAAALLAFGLASPKGWALRASAIVIGVGACLFSLSLAGQSLMGVVVLPMAAPAGGTAIIVGWILVAAGGLIARR